MDAKVRVAVRCRPFLSNETNRRRMLSFTNDTVVFGDKRFGFERVFGEESRQDDVYNFCVKSLVDGCFEGYNGTVFAYGQTGSGKTHSIMGSLSADHDDEETGIIPRAVQQIFRTLHSNSASLSRMATVRVSMIELYNDECKDLLHPEIPSRDIMIREDKHGRIFFTGAREEVATSAEVALQYLEIGNINRSTAETLMNQTSSRSHAIFTISLEIIEYGGKNAEGQEESSFIHAKLHLVDLAGSERAKKTGASGQRFKESVGINQGLLSLGKVIRALTTNPVTHIPYRESKLTRFLQDSLGGNSRTVLLACVSPSELSLSETINTIQYAQRAKAINNKIVANVATGVIGSELQNDLESSLVVSLRAEIIRMQQELTTMGGGAGATGATDITDHQQYEQRIHQHQQLLRSMRNTLQTTLQQHGSGLEGVSPTVLRERFEQVLSIHHRLLQLVSDALIWDQSSQGGGSRPGTAAQMQLQSAAALRKSLRESWAELHPPANIAPAALEDELRQVKAELEECREDLKRDEEIFALKVSELKKARKSAKSLETEKAALLERNQVLQQQVLKLARIPKMFVSDFDLEETTATITAGGSPSKPPRDPMLIPASPSDDLDVSIAVAMTEPDISQLMEDFEAVWKENEDLRSRNTKVEDHVSKIQAVAQNQRDKVSKMQLAYQKKIKAKDVLLKERTKEVQEFQDEVKVLRGDVDDLRDQRHRLQQELQQMRRESDAHSDANDRLRSLAESVQQLSDERGKLVLRVRDLEASQERQLKVVDALQREVADKDSEMEHRGIVMDEQQRKLRDELRATKEQLAKRESERDELRNNNNNRPKSASGGGASRQSQSESVHTWLEDTLAAVVREGVAHVEVLRLQNKLDLLRKEHESTVKALETLKAPPPSASKAAAAAMPELSSKVQAIDEKIRQLRDRAAAIAAQLREAERARDADLITRRRKELQEVEYNLEAYEEHRSEFAERLNNNNNNSSNNANKVNAVSSGTVEEESELRDDLESVEAEITAMEARLQQEVQRLQRVQEVNSKRFNALTSSESPTNNNNSSSKKKKKTNTGGVFHLDHIVAQIVQDMRAQQGGGGSPNEDVDSLFQTLLKVQLSQRIKAEANEGSWAETRQQLEAKCEEYNDLVKQMQHMRNEALKKQEQLRREGEEKVAFLLQQLRAVEHASSTPASSSGGRKTHSSSGSGGGSTGVRDSSPPMPPPRPPSRGRGGVNGGSELDDGGMPLSARSDVSASSSNSTAVVQRLRQSGVLRAKKSAQDLTSAVAASASLFAGDEDLLHRWSTEKERREQLERRNAELVQEIRVMRTEQVRDRSAPSRRASSAGRAGAASDDL